MNKSNRTKFNVDKNTAKRMSDDGIVFDSILEKNFYQEVILPNVQSGIIVEYELQKKYILQNDFKRKKHTVRAITYVADFYVKLYNGKEFVLDTKGMPDSVAKIKRKLFWHNYPLIDYYWVAYSKIDGGWLDYEFIQKQRRNRKRHPELVSHNKIENQRLLEVNFFEKIDKYTG